MSRKSSENHGTLHMTQLRPVWSNAAETAPALSGLNSEVRADLQQRSRPSTPEPLLARLQGEVLESAKVRTAFLGDSPVSWVVFGSFVAWISSSNACSSFERALSAFGKLGASLPDKQHAPDSEEDVPSLSAKSAQKLNQLASQISDGSIESFLVPLRAASWSAQRMAAVKDAIDPSGQGTPTGEHFAHFVEVNHTIRVRVGIIVMVRVRVMSKSRLGLWLGLGLGLGLGLRLVLGLGLGSGGGETYFHTGRHPRHIRHVVQ